MKAVIMAGGEGVRLRPLTCGLPKPMVPVAGKPVLSHIIELLKKHGVTDIAITLKYCPGRIRQYFEDGSAWGVRLTYFTEDHPLGTAGSVAACKNFLSPDEDFLVMSGDSMTDVDLTEAVSFHRRHVSKATMVLSRSEHPMDYGVVLAEKNGAIKGFLEKPDCHHLMGDLVNTGIYILHPSLLSFCPENTPFDFAKDLFPAAMKAGIAFWGYTAQFYWCDIGKPEAYLEANRFALEGRSFVDPSAILEENVIVHQPVWIGPGVYVGARSEIGPYVSVGSGGRIGREARLTSSVLWEDCAVRSGGTVSDSILCQGVEIGRNSVVLTSVLGDGCRTGDYSYVAEKSRIWPRISVEEESHLQGVTYMSPDQAGPLFSEEWPLGWRFLCRSAAEAVRFGWVYGQLAGVGSTVCVPDIRQGHALPALLGLAAGLLSSGAVVKKVEGASLPLLRWMGRKGLCDGAVMIEAEDGSLWFSVTDKNGNEPDSQFRKRFRQKMEQAGEPATANVFGHMEEMLSPEEFYTAELAERFPEAYQHICFGGRHFTQKEKEGLIAEIVAEFYPESPLFVSCASELPARAIGEKNGLSVRICGGLPGDVMAAMALCKNDEGVAVQRLMLFDDLGFELGLAHFRTMGMEDSLVCARKFPGVYSQSSGVACGNSRKAGLVGYFASLPEFEGTKDFTDGLSVRDGTSTVRLCPEESRGIFRIQVESLNAEFARDMTQHLTDLAKHWLEDEKKEAAP